VEHFVGLYVFVTYLEETDFLFDRQSVSYELDFHGSFYAGIVSFACSMLAALVVYVDDSISKVHKESAVEDFDVGYMLPEEFVLYQRDDWNVMDDHKYNAEGSEQNGISRFVPVSVSTMLVGCRDVKRTSNLRTSKYVFKLGILIFAIHIQLALKQTLALKCR